MALQQVNSEALYSFKHVPNNYISTVVIKCEPEKCNEKKFILVCDFRVRVHMSIRRGTGAGNLNMKLRDHIFKHKREAERENFKWSKAVL